MGSCILILFCSEHKLCVCVCVCVAICACMSTTLCAYNCRGGGAFLWVPSCLVFFLDMQHIYFLYKFIYFYTSAFLF